MLSVSIDFSWSHLVDRFIKDYDGIKYLVLLSSEKYDAIFERIRYLIGWKSGISYVPSHNY